MTRDEILQSMKDSLQTEVYLEEKAVRKINRQIYRDISRECGGFFIGSVAQDAVSGRPLVSVTDCYVENRFGTAGNFEFTTDYIMNAVKYIRRNCPGSHLIGNWHSHGIFPAFWSDTDYMMMQQARENCFYMVVSPSHGTWEAVYKDMDFHFHTCSLRMASTEECGQMFTKSVACRTIKGQAGGESVQRSDFRTFRRYSHVQKHELDRRFLHSRKDLEGKKVLIVGAGNIGNLVVQYAVCSGVGELAVVDMDSYEYWNAPRSAMLRDRDLGRPKAPALAEEAARMSPFSVRITGINADICCLGWGFLEQFDLVISAVDSAAVRQYIDRGCRLFHLPHITCGTSTLDGDFTGNVLYFPKDSVVDLEYVWGRGYRARLQERRSCSDLPDETQAQVMGFSAQIAGMAMDVALKCLLGRIEDERTARKWVLNSVGCGIERDRRALRAYKYGRLPEGTSSELYDALRDCDPVRTLTFDISRPKGELWEMLRSFTGEEIPSFRLDLEWSMNFPVAYRSSGAVAMLEVPKGCGPDPLLERLPFDHIYLVQGEERDYLVRLILEGPQEYKKPA